MESFGLDKICNFKMLESARGRRMLVIFIVIGVALTLLSSGKYRMNLDAITVSPDEQYIACFESQTHEILCFRADGSQAFTYEIPSDVDAGGYCVLWFEEDVLCALFYRTEKVARFSTDGSILEIVENTLEEDPETFPSFSHEGTKYIFRGNEITVEYNQRKFLGYWLFGAERYLAITPKDGEIKVVFAWTAKDGVIEPTNDVLPIV